MDVYWSKSTYAAWKHIPTTFVRCEEDRVLPMAYVDMMLEQVKASTPTGLDNIESIKSGHFPFLSKVEEVVAILKKAAGENL
jgi:pimeloyl-ACP methyl ester carboxylesterase